MPVTDGGKQAGISKASRFSVMDRRNRSLRQRNPALARKLEDMRITIQPILHIKHGVPAPYYPATQISFFLLTEAKLDSIAHFYDQCCGGDFKYEYPQTMDWSLPFLDNNADLPPECKLTDLERLKVKMRMFARFIGMRGADTPTWEYERQIEILAEKMKCQVREEEEKRNGKAMLKGPERRKGPPSPKGPPR